jgi:hypothetical protein
VADHARVSTCVFGFPAGLYVRRAPSRVLRHPPGPMAKGLRRALSTSRAAGQDDGSRRFVFGISYELHLPPRTEILPWGRVFPPHPHHVKAAGLVRLASLAGNYDHPLSLTSTSSAIIPRPDRAMVTRLPIHASGMCCPPCGVGSTSASPCRLPAAGILPLLRPGAQPRLSAPLASIHRRFIAGI